MNLFERLKPESAKHLAIFTAKYPSLGEEVKKELVENIYLTKVTYGTIIHLKCIIPSKIDDPKFLPQDLFQSK
jgi:hypothetical protein